jgi:hypothetical protein
MRTPGRSVPAFGPAIGLKISGPASRVLHLGGQGTVHAGSRFGDELNRVHYYGVEGGARFDFGPIGVLPYLAVSLARVHTQQSYQGIFNAFGLAPALATDASVGVFSVGLDARWFYVPTGARAHSRGPLFSGAVFATVGVRLTGNQRSD